MLLRSMSVKKVLTPIPGNSGKPAEPTALVSRYGWPGQSKHAQVVRAVSGVPFISSPSACGTPTPPSRFGRGP
jgi:hypothetical protein